MSGHIYLDEYIVCIKYNKRTSNKFPILSCYLRTICSTKYNGDDYMILNCYVWSLEDIEKITDYLLTAIRDGGAFVYSISFVLDEGIGYRISDIVELVDRGICISADIPFDVFAGNGG